LVPVVIYKHDYSLLFSVTVRLKQQMYGFKVIRESPNMPSAPFYNMVGQPVSPHAAYLPPHSGHTTFNPAPSHPARLQYPGFAHALHPTSMTMVQNPQAMVHQSGAPPLAGNIGLDMAAMVPGSQVGAFQQNQLGHLGWTTQSF
jgi:hypothetical protein